MIRMLGGDSEKENLLLNQQRKNNSNKPTKGLSTDQPPDIVQRSRYIFTFPPYTNSKKSELTRRLTYVGLLVTFYIR
ncbi:unnamed protein product [Rhizophagus irregularis]|nr:unnamed protein product [Rhizophagus irregularis]